MDILCTMNFIKDEKWLCSATTLFFALAALLSLIASNLDVLSLLYCLFTCSSLLYRLIFLPLFLHFLSKVNKGFLDVLPSFGTSFKEMHAELFGQISALLRFNHLFFYHVTLVAHKEFLDVQATVRVRFKLADPMAH